MDFNEFSTKLTQKLAKDKEKREHDKNKEKLSKEKALKKFDKISTKIVEAFSMACELETNNISLDGKLIAKYTTGCHVDNKFGIICKKHFRPCDKGVRNLETIGIIVPTDTYNCYNKYFVDIETHSLKKYYCEGSEIIDKTTNLTSAEIKDFTKKYIAWRKDFDVFVDNVLAQ